VIGSTFGTLLGVLALLVLVGMVAAGVALLLIGRTLLRRWRLLRSHGAVVAALAVWDATSSWRSRRRPPDPAAVSGEKFWSSPRDVRRALRRSVDAAVDSVRTADELGAPVAELPAVCRRLQAAATDLDRVIRLDQAGSVPPSVRGQVRDVVQAATDVRRVAVAAAGHACDPAVAELVRDVADEARLLEAGLARTRSVALPPR
jgi:hypothetical protein